MIKTLMKSIREYKKSSILTPVFMIGEVIMEVLIPYIMADLIDIGFADGNMPFIIKQGLILALFAMISLAFGVLGAKTGAEASTGFAKNLRKDMYARVQTFSFSNIDKFSTASIVTRLTTDVTNVQNAYMMIIRIAVRVPIMLIVAIVMTALISWKLALIFACVVPVLLIVLFGIVKVVFPIFNRIFRTYDKLNNVVQENLYGIRVVKSFVREDHEKEKFGGISEIIYQDFSKAEKILAFNSPIMQTAVYISMLLISWMGAHFVIAGEPVTAAWLGTVFTTGLLNSVFTYTMQILMSCMMLSMVFVMITMAEESAKRIAEVLEENPDITNPKNPVMKVEDGSIRFDNVSFSYTKDPNKLCLSDVNIDIPTGSTVGIIGGTGSSKSSLVQLIPRLYDVTQGSLYVGGVDVRNYDIETLRNEVAMVLQKNVLFSGTIKENLRWGNANASDEELIHACKLAAADGFISEFPDKYDTHIEQGGTNVSGGQRQRICIARALVKKPKVLILDDSTSAVDTATDAQIRKAFREEIPDTTKIVIAQRVSSVQDSDIIIVMDNGKINAVGKHQELLSSNDIYREVYLSQQKGGEEDGK